MPAEPPAAGGRLPEGPQSPIVMVAARNEEERIGATLDALGRAFPGAELIVADDASGDATARIARERGARVVRGERSRGKGANVAAATQVALELAAGDDSIVLLCDADLGDSAARLGPLVESVERGECDLAIAAFARRIGGGFGIALRFSRWAVERRCGVRLAAPISGQRAMRAGVLRRLLPFALGFGLETGMDIDAARAGYRVCEIELDLEHRATRRTPRGFLHRARQLRDFVRVYLSRR